MMKTYRQGDLLFKQVSDQPKQVESKRLTIAEGEQTGHHHVLVAETDSVILGDKTSFTVKGKAKVVINEREWNYVDKLMEKVRD